MSHYGEFRSFTELPLREMRANDRPVRDALRSACEDAYPADWTVTTHYVAHALVGAGAPLLAEVTAPNGFTMIGAYIDKVGSVTLNKAGE